MSNDETPRVEVSRSWCGLCYMQVCAVEDATNEEILEVCNRDNPAGTSGGWQDVVREDAEDPEKNPVQCEDHPNRKHFLAVC